MRFSRGRSTPAILANVIPPSASLLQMRLCVCSFVRSRPPRQPCCRPADSRDAHRCAASPARPGSRGRLTRRRDCCPPSRACQSAHYPWRCLCFGLLQMTRTTPSRRMIWHLSHSFLTDGRTFMTALPSSPGRSDARQTRRPGAWRHVASPKRPTKLHCSTICRF